MKGGENVVRLLVIEPGYCPYTANFDSVDAATQETILGAPQLYLPFDTSKIGLLCSKNQEGLKYNRQINDDTAVYGRCLVCGVSDGHPVGLSKEQANRYSRKYYLPENPLQEDEFPTAKIKPVDERFGQKLRFWER